MDGISLIFSLFVTVLKPILQVSLLCIAGYFLARNGLLDTKLQKQLNHLNIIFFTPALLFSRIAFFLTPEKLRELLVVPVSFVIIIGVSMMVALIVGRVCHLKPSHLRFAIAATMFQNCNFLTIPLMRSIINSVPNLNWGPNDTQEEMFGRALSYLMLFFTLSIIVRYSYGLILLRPDPDELTQQNRPRGEHRSAMPLLLSFDNNNYHTIQPPRNGNSEAGTTLQPLPIDFRPTQRPSILPRLYAAFTEIMTPPIWSSLASLLVASIPSIQSGLTQHFVPLVEAIKSVGDCSIPLSLVVLGGYFVPDGADEDPGLDHIDVRPEDAKTRGETKTIIVSVVSRMILTPLILIPALATLIKCNVHPLLTDPVFIISTVLLISSPVALTLSQVTNAAASGQSFERLVSRTIFWSYVLVTPPAMTMTVVLGLLLLRH